MNTLYYIVESIPLCTCTSYSGLRPTDLLNPSIHLGLMVDHRNHLAYRHDRARNTSIPKKMHRCHYDISPASPLTQKQNCNAVGHRGGLNGAALLDLYLTEVMENPAECDDR